MARTLLPKIASLADIEAIEKEPLETHWIPETTYETIARTASTSPHAPALSFLMEGKAHENGTTISYAQLIADITRAANLFGQLETSNEAPVAILLPNCLEFHFAFWGAEACSAAAPINPLLEAKQISALLNTLKARVLVTLAPLPQTNLFEKAIEATRDVASINHILTVDLTTYLPYSKSSVAKLLTLPARLKARGAVSDFRRACQIQSSEMVAALPNPHQVCSYFATGGTTGHPKIASHTHTNETFDAWAISQATQIGPKDVFFCGLPLFHVNGMIVTGLSPFAAGAHVILGTPQGYRNPEVIQNFWALIERWKVTSFSGVPTLYSTLLKQDRGSADLSSLRFAACGAAPMSAELIRRFETETGVPILEGYGLTEATCASTLNPAFGQRKPGSIGLRLPYQQMKAVITNRDGAYMRDAAIGETGVIAVKGPNVFPGYLDRKHDAGIWFGEGWLNTGDLGFQDPDGYFHLTGRAKDLIIRGGHNIDPKVIEEALATHAAVDLVAAVGCPDLYAGELPIAFVILKRGMTATSEDIITFARATIAERAAVPVAVEILDTLPQTAVGKIFKPELRRQAAEKAIRMYLDTQGQDHQGIGVTLDTQSSLTVTCTDPEVGELLKEFALRIEVVEPKEKSGEISSEQRS